jgi:hypothetical protein
MSKDKEPPKGHSKTWVSKLSKPKVAANSDSKAAKGRSLGDIKPASSVPLNSKNIPSPESVKRKAIRKPVSSKWTEKENIPKPSKSVPKKQEQKRVVRPPASKNKPVAKAPAKRQVRPPGSKPNVTPTKRPPTVKKAPKISRGPKR